MATRDELYPSQWLKATDLTAPVIATIDHTTTERVGTGAKAERKLVIHFRGGTLKPWIVNATNFDVLVGMSGEEDSDRWTGLIVELYATDVLGPHGPTRGIRTRRPSQRSAPARPAPTQRQTMAAAPPDEPPRYSDDDINAALGATEFV